MIYGSVCSGIEAATVAWDSLGWKPAWFSEIEKFPCDVLADRHSKITNLGDMTKIHKTELFNERPIELLVGGTPCQSFSIAGLRKGMVDPRGNLALTFLSILDRKRPKWMVWENVPGVLSSWSDEEGSNGVERRWQSNDFDTFLCGLKELGYGFAWRILDAQFIGVPQRRRRVFVVGYFGDWRPAAAVLFERHSLSWDSPPSREAGQGTSVDVAPGLTASGRGVERTGETRGQDPVIAVPDTANTLIKRMHKGINTTVDEGQTPIIAFMGGQGSKAGSIAASEETSPTIKGSGGGNATPSVAFAQNSRDEVRKLGGDGKISGALAAEPGAKQQTYLLTMRGGKPGGGKGALVQKNRSGAIATNNAQTLFHGMSVRRLTPRECERLQGFPDDYTLIYRAGKLAADGPRYKALGNSMAVPVMAWLGRRIDMVVKLLKAA